VVKAQVFLGHLSPTDTTKHPVPLFDGVVVDRANGGAKLACTTTTTLSSTILRVGFTPGLIRGCKIFSVLLIIDSLIGRSFLSVGLVMDHVTDRFALLTTALQAILVSFLAVELAYSLHPPTDNALLQLYLGHRNLQREAPAPAGSRG